MIFIIVMNAFVGITYIAAGPFLHSYTPEISLSSLLISGILSLLNVVFAIAIWKFKKWGFYGYLGVTVAAFVINLIYGANMLVALLGFVGVAILYFLLKPIWNYMS